MKTLSGLRGWGGGFLKVYPLPRVSGITGNLPLITFVIFCAGVHGKNGHQPKQYINGSVSGQHVTLATWSLAGQRLGFTPHTTIKMKTFFLVLALAAVALAKSDFEDCPGSNNAPYANPIHLRVMPDPLVVKKGHTVKFHFDILLHKTVQAGSKIHVHMDKSGIPLPCLPVSFFLTSLSTIP